MLIQRKAEMVTEWFVAFSPRCLYRWPWLVPGRFKHCVAFGYSDACRTWVYYDLTMVGTRIYLLPDGPAAYDNLIVWLRGATVLKAKMRDAAARRPWLGFYCVTAVRHLVGSRCGAVTPSGLYDGLLREGAEVVANGWVKSASGTGAAA